MKKLEFVYRELLFQTMEKRQRILSQAELARQLHVSLSTVHHSLTPLIRMGAIQVKPRNFHVINSRKVLVYWASVRNLHFDVVYQTRVNVPVSEIEKRMPGDVVFGAYSAYKFLFNRVPADYSEIYVYAADLKELEKRFPKTAGPPNLFVLKKTMPFMTMTLGHLFVDLWNLKEWYAKEFLNELEEHIHGLLA